jgi:hypothetical protein
MSCVSSDELSVTAKFVDAGAFGAWLAQARAALRGNGGSDVPCGDCNGCCTSGYAVQVRPEDTRTLASVPSSVLVPAPRLPKGNAMMIPLSNGHCPMYVGGGCSIYRDRPQTCLDYDCRIFSAAGIAAGGTDKVVINRRVAQWRFDYPLEADRCAHRAVQATAAFIRNHGDCFVGMRVPTAPTGVAVLAIKAYTVFLDTDVEKLDASRLAAAIVQASREFDSPSGVTV